MSRPFFFTVQEQGVMVLGAGHCWGPCRRTGGTQSASAAVSSHAGTGTILGWLEEVIYVELHDMAEEAVSLDNGGLILNV